MKEYLFFDMDGVLVDFEKKLNACLELGYPRDVYKWMENFYLDLEPMPGALEAYRELDRHYDCYILSAPSWGNASCYTDKRLWVERHLGEIAKKKLILTHNTGMHSGRALIDDRTKYGVPNFRGEHIHFGTEKFPDWKSVLDHLIPKEHRLTAWQKQLLAQEQWRGVEGAEYQRVFEATKSLEPYESSSSLHISEDRYKLPSGTYRLLYAIGYDDRPDIEKLIQK